MLAWYHLFGASISAAVVALLGHWLMAKREERRRTRRVFAASIHQCCEELEDAAIRYWAGKDGGEDAPILMARMKAALMKMARFVQSDSNPAGEKERLKLEQEWSEAQKTTTGGEFETREGRPNPEQAARAVAKITAIRAEIAGMMAE